MRAFIILLLAAAATAELAQLIRNKEPIPGKYIVKVKDEYAVEDIISTVRIMGGRVGAKWSRVFRGFAVELSDKLLEMVLSHPAVKYVEQEGIYRAQQSDLSWGLDRIDQTSSDLDGIYDPGNAGGKVLYGKGTGYTVYVIDTGIRATHTDFEGRAQQLVNFIGWNDNEDCNGHGTHCAGTVGSATYGVAKDVQLLGVKVLSCNGAGSTSAVVSGIEYVEEHATGNANAIASMSLGGGASQAIDDAVEALVTSGVSVVVAAGNDNADACNSSPARSDKVITVGSTNNLDRRSSFSNYGTCVDIFAPGSQITSTWNTDDSSTSTISGTSMACPHVAGALALYRKDATAMKNRGSVVGLGNMDGSSPDLLLNVADLS